MGDVDRKEAFKAVEREFRADLSRAAVAYALAWGGAAFVADQLRKALEGLPSGPGVPERRVFFNRFGTEPKRPYVTVEGAEAQDVLAEEGPTLDVIGHQWVVFVSASWEHNFRARLAAAAGCKRDDIELPLLGDLRLIRNDILHCRARATDEHTGKCTSLGWFGVGDAICIRTKHVEEFQHRMGGPEGTIHVP